MTYKLSQLPYDKNDLEPYIDTRTMSIHHDFIEGAYIQKINQTLANYPNLLGKNPIELLSSLDTLPNEVRQSIRNNVGGYFNHTMQWPVFAPDGGGEPTGNVADAIVDAFGSFESFKEKFSLAASGIFGSGWVWLCVGADNKFVIKTTPNEDNPVMEGFIPVFGLDMWEHAYYLKYENRREDYIKALWSIINWKNVSKSYDIILLSGGINQIAEWAGNTLKNIQDGLKGLFG